MYSDSFKSGLAVSFCNGTFLDHNDLIMSKTFYDHERSVVKVS